MTKRLKAAFMGSPDFAVPSLHATARSCELAVVVSQPDRPAGRGRKLKAPPVKEAALRLGLPVLQPTKVRDGSLEAALGEYDLDVIIVVAYGRILPTEILELPRYGCINVHASLLPRWRGAAPIQRAVLAGDEETGVAIMQMDEGCDTGPVFRMISTPIGAEESSGELFERLATLGGEALEAFLNDFPEVPAAQAQDHEKAVHAAKLEKAEGAVQWVRSAKEVKDHIRGMDPWPAAYASRGDAKIKLYGATVAEREKPEGASAGEVLGKDEGGLLIACGDGVVRVRDLQAPGKKRMPASAYLAGHPFGDGEGFE